MIYIISVFWFKLFSVPVLRISSKSIVTQIPIMHSLLRDPGDWDEAVELNLKLLKSHRVKNNNTNAFKKRITNKLRPQTDWRGGI